MKPFVSIVDRSLKKIYSVIYRPFSMMGISQNGWAMYSDTEGSSDSWYSVNATFDNQTELEWKPPPYHKMGGWEKKKHFREMNFYASLGNKASVLGRAAFAVWCANQLAHGDSEILNKIHYLTVFHHWTKNEPPNMELGWFEPARRNVTKNWNDVIRLVPVHRVHDSYSMCADWVSTEDDNYCNVNWVICPKTCPNTGDNPEYKGYLWKETYNSDHDEGVGNDNGLGIDKKREKGIYDKIIVRADETVHDGSTLQFMKTGDGNTTSRGVRWKGTEANLMQEQWDDRGNPSPVMVTGQLQQQQKIQFGLLIASGFFYSLFRFCRRYAKPSTVVTRKRK